MKSDYRSALKDDESLALFLRNMAKFDKSFCDLMAAGVEYTLRLEIHGNKGELIHVRVNHDGFDRPKGSQKRLRSEKATEPL